MQAVQVSDDEVDEFLAEFNAKPILQKEPGTVPLDPFEKDASSELDTFKEVRQGNRIEVYGLPLVVTKTSPWKPWAMARRDRLRMLSDHEPCRPNGAWAAVCCCPQSSPRVAEPRAPDRAGVHPDSMAEGGSQMQEPLKALSELELLVQACQEDMAKAISKARLAVLRAGGVKAVSLGDSHPATPVTPRTPRSVKTGPGLEKSQQPSLRGDESIPLYRSQDENPSSKPALATEKSFEYPYTTDAFCNSLDVKSVKSMAVPSLKSPTFSVQEGSPRTPKSLAPSSMETTLPCAPVNSDVGQERRTSKGSMAGPMISELPMSQHLHREKLDTIIGVIVLLNSFTMVMELECEGQIAGEKVGFREQLHCHQNVFFLIAEHVFTIIFVAD
eukprot:s2664_g3.t1